MIDWIPGLNLLTFKMYSGIFPVTDVIKREVANRKFVSHTDWNVHNMVVSGNSIQMIDVADPRYQDKICSYTKERRSDTISL